VSAPADGAGDDVGVGLVGRGVGVLGRCAGGTNGEAALGVPVEVAAGLKGGGAAAAGLNGGAGGGVNGDGPRGANSGMDPDGVGGVAVADATGRSAASLRGRDAPEGSTFLGCAAGGGGGALDRLGATGAGARAAGGVAARGAALAGVFEPVGAGIDITPLHTEHRARTPAGGTFAGSTRKIERQSGQLTFIHFLQSV
jgi:hypothetical protein